jgi:ubiquinone/menaquinone biosynthesis C-methylase UbiE
MHAPEADHDRFSFAPFSRHAFFTNVNKWIVERVVEPSRRLIVDLGCGPGGVTQLILDRLGDQTDARVIGIDPSPSALERARAAIRSRIAEFIEGTAEGLSRLVSHVDLVVFLNAIHLVPDKAQVLTGIRKTLKPGGVLAFNTSFYSGAYPEGTASFWRRWVVRAVQVLRERGIELKKEGTATARQFLTPEDYRELCVKAGFREPKMEVVTAEMTREGLADIGRFSLFIEGALPGVPLDVGCDALQEGLKRTLSETGITSVPRNWLECVAEAA